MFLPDQRGDPFELRYRKLTALIARSRSQLPDRIRNLPAACLVNRGGIEVFVHQQQKYAIEWLAEIDLAEPLAAPAAGQDAASLDLKPLTVAVPNSNASTGDFYFSRWSEPHRLDNDITYVPTWEGFLYLAIVLDVWSLRVVGWVMANHLRTALVLDAFEMALAPRRPESVIHHSDRGCQYTSYAFGKRCREAGVVPSMGSTGDAYDNAMAESFFATLEREVIDHRRFKSRAEARMAIFTWLEGWYNPHRRHSALGYLSPINYERKMLSRVA